MKPFEIKYEYGNNKFCSLSLEKGYIFFFRTARGCLDFVVDIYSDFRKIGCIYGY